MASPEWLDGRCAVHSAIGSSRTTATIHPERFTRALVDAACARGARLVRGAVEGIGRDANGRVRGVRVDGTEIAADAVVIAMGPWSILAAQWLPLPPVAGLKGYSVVLAPRAPVPAQALFVEYESAAGERTSPEIVARADGEVWACGLSSDDPLPINPADVTVDEVKCREIARICAALVEPSRRRGRPPHPGLLPADLRGRDAAARCDSGRPGRLRRDRPQLLGHAERPGERARDGRAALRRRVVERRPRAVRSGPAGGGRASTPPRTGRERALNHDTNILFIMCDQLRWDYLSCYGHPHLRTPNIDGLAARGVRFTRAYCQAPLCGPSRSSFHTGRYMSSHGAMANEDPLKPGELTLGDCMRDLGIAPVLVGKMDVSVSRDALERLGVGADSAVGRSAAAGGFEPFEDLQGLYPDPILPPRLGYNDYLRARGYHGENPWELYANSATDADGRRVSGWQMRHAGLPARVAEAHSETAFTTDRAIEFLEQTPDDRRWCLHLSYIKPHWPYIAPDPYHRLYSR